MYINFNNILFWNDNKMLKIQQKFIHFKKNDVVKKENMQIT